MSKAKSLIVELRYDAQTITTLELKPGDGEVMVGRKDVCQLRIPREDPTASHEHARIYFKSGHFFIVDNQSRNGVYRDGKKLKGPARLNGGEIYSIGNSLLVITESASGGGRVDRAYDRLRFVDGDHKGKDVEIHPSDEATGNTFIVGSDPKCDLAIKDPAVSRRHIAIKLNRGGGCYVQDLGSRNGTLVNGEKLEGKERPLKHRDIIQIAYIELMFIDHTMPVPPPPPWRLLMKLVVVAAVLSTGWIMWHLSKPSAAQWREVSRKMAMQENFAGAFGAITNAYGSRGGEKDSTITDALDQQLREWQRTYRTWAQVRGWLGRGYLNERTMQTLGTIHPEMEPDYGNWAWNDVSASTQHQEADFSYRLLRLLYDNGTVRRKNPVDRVALERAIRYLDDYVASNATTLAELPYLAAATNCLFGQERQLKMVRDQVRQVDEAIEKVRGDGEAGAPDFQAATRILETLLADKQLNAGVRTDAERKLAICREFFKTQEFLKREFGQLTSMEFESLYAGRDQLPMPDNDQCAHHPVFSQARDRYQAMHQAYQREGAVLAPMIRNLNDGGVTGAEPGELLERICDGKVWDVALGFDCFAGRFPLPSRDDPNSVYDELFGIETTYENLRSLEKAPNRSNRLERNFVPLTTKAFLVFEQVRTFRTVMDRDDAKSYRIGRLGEFYTLASRIQEMRDELVAMLKARQAKGGGGADLNRSQLVAGYFSEYFSGKGEESYANLRALASAFKKLEKQTNALEEQYEHEVDPEKRLKIRSQVLAVGLPGSEVVRKHWVDMADGGR